MKLTIIRGLPGSGKTTLAKTLGCAHFAADDRMVDAAGAYAFDPSRLRECHEGCQADAREILRRGWGDVAVHNTFSQAWEWAPYLRMARECGATVEIVDLYDAGLSDRQLAERCVHGVPETTIAAMRQRWEK